MCSARTCTVQALGNLLGALQDFDARRHLSAPLGPRLACGGTFVDLPQPLHDMRRLHVVAVIRLRQGQRVSQIEAVDVAERIAVAGYPFEAAWMPIQRYRGEQYAAFRFRQLLGGEFVEHGLAPRYAPRFERNPVDCGVQFLGRTLP